MTDYDDLTYPQVRVLAAMSRVNLNRGTPQTEGVVPSTEGLNMNSVWALATRGIVWWDAHDGKVHLQRDYVDLANECREAVEA